MNQPLARPLHPPRYVNVPVSLAYAAGNHPAILTLIRIVGLCWQRGGHRTPALTQESLAGALHQTPWTLRRHLDHLQARGWLQVDRQGDRLVLRPKLERIRPEGQPPPLERAGGGQEPAPRTGPGPAPVLNHEVQQALAEAGIENPVRDQLAGEPGLDPVWVHAWHLWTQHPERSSLGNPAGYIVQQLRAGHPPPDAYCQLASLSEEQIIQLRMSYWTGGQDLNEDLYALRPTFLEFFPEG